MAETGVEAELAILGYPPAQADHGLERVGQRRRRPTVLGGVLAVEGAEGGHVVAMRWIVCTACWSNAMRTTRLSTAQARLRHVMC